MKYEEQLIVAVYKASKKKDVSPVLDLVESILEELIADIPDELPDNIVDGFKVEELNGVWLKQQLKSKWL